MKRILPLLVLAVLLVKPAGAEDDSRPAGPEDTGRITLGTSGITNPNPPANKDSAWSGSYVYFGEYNGKPIRFRVLAKDSTAYTEGGALFLDSDVSLFDSIFDDEEPYSNSWNGSSLQKKLNGDFLAGFDAPEQAAVAFSTGNGGISWPEDLPEDSWWGVPVSVNDRVFLLDHAETRNEAYGYSADNGFHYSEENNKRFTHMVLNRKKAGSPRTGCWMLRTACAENSENRGWHVLGVLPDGGFFTKNAADAGVYSGSGGIGIAPALNVDQRFILFTTRIGTDEFKLTIIDDGLTVAVPEGRTVSAEGRTVTIPHGIGGPDAKADTRAAILILDREYIPGNPNGAAVLHYGALDAEGVLSLPEGLDPEGWGTDYHVCLFAENLNGTFETDYASFPVPLNRPGTLPAAGKVRVPPEEIPEQAADKDRNNTGLGTAGIANPVPGGETGALWAGNYVYFGKYNGKPIRFRVLAKDSTAYTEERALFLDSDETLFVSCFDNTEPVSAAWAESEIRILLNGSFLDGFAAPERAAIAHSTGDGGRGFAPGSPEADAYGAPVPVDDRVFLPDVADVTNPAYGCAASPGWKYIFLPGEGVPNHIKTGAFTFWWLRSAAADKPRCAADVNAAGTLNELETDCYLGVAPALNVDQRAVLFSTRISPKEFKLTLSDNGLRITVPEGKAVTLAGKTVRVPYEIGGTAAGDGTRATVLILDRAYSAGNENGAAILHYGPANDLPDGGFTLPEGCDPEGWGTDYFVYILAENRHGMYETDYASVPVAVEAPGASAE